jgi:hypothetical protein
VFILREKHKGFEPKLLSGKTSRETRALKQKGANKNDFNSRKGKTSRSSLRKGERQGKDTDLGIHKKYI